MTLVISKGITLRKGWQPMDADAAAYIAAVETTDTEPLEERTKIAIDNFVLGCKADGIWNAIKASCILAGARTLNGALVPLVGAAPTNFNFVSGDYNRKTGLVGNGSTKYLDSNRNNNSDPQDSKHLSVYVNTANTAGVNRGYIGAGISTTGSSNIFTVASNSNMQARINCSGGAIIGTLASTGFMAASRTAADNTQFRSAGTETSTDLASQSPIDQNIIVFGRDLTAQATGRLAFYSIGESLNLALLDARVTDLINGFAAAIP